jgi:hypothetical protein
MLSTGSVFQITVTVILLAGDGEEGAGGQVLTGVRRIDPPPLPRGAKL